MTATGTIDVSALLGEFPLNISSSFIVNSICPFQ
jgi:hypothetical protein